MLGPLGGGVDPDWLAADCALAANDPLGTTPPFDFAVADWIRAAAAFDIEFLGITYSNLIKRILSPLGQSFKDNRGIRDKWVQENFRKRLKGC